MLLERRASIFTRKRFESYTFFFSFSSTVDHFTSLGKLYSFFFSSKVDQFTSLEKQQVKDKSAS